ncbi:calcium/sodium antiporter [Roseicyclus sp. F158]|uniref:Calcium/sodium antiporter n=1 Tax=Tropicimonas omnivorans TaxID=3075590 RepID=A0ABU3DCG9_9RHOB|nr:calcium/sodium antiporter [Roseicyclus sp. F158]MDT0681393.1 calcium/sodium antiporter [Roseicyclus sp. F158]
MIVDVLLVLVGLALLLFAGDALVKGAVNLALRVGIPALIVSLTVVAFGTSAPELLISVAAVLDDAAGLALGNVVGSNIANVLLVIGVPALVFGMSSMGPDSKRSFVVMLGATAIFIAMAFAGPFMWIHGLILLALLAAVLTDSALDARRHRKASKAKGPEEDLEGADASMSGKKIALYLVLGLVGLPIGAQILVTSAVSIAETLHVPDTVIGLTLVAIGTSLPELATTFSAVKQRQADVAIGNVIGSNIFNLLGIIGVAALVGPIPVDPQLLRVDLWVMAAAALLLLPAVMWQKRMGRVFGGVLLVLYAAYLVAAVA